MNAEVVFAAMYAIAMALAGLGLERAGRAGTRRRPRPTSSEDVSLPWPHADSIALHAAVAAVAVLASLVLLAVMMIRHHGVADLATLAAPGLIGIATLRVLLARGHGIVRGSPQPASDAMPPIPSSG